MINFIFISISIILLYLIIILISFDPADPGWLQIKWHGPIHNLGGILGAKLSDFLFFVFGVPAYIIPFFILFYIFKVYAQGNCNTIFEFFFKLIGILILLFVCCGLTHLIIDDLFYFSSGGIIGSILCDFILSYEKITYHISFILLFLIVIIDLIVFFNRFFNMIVKTIKNQLSFFVAYLRVLVFYDEKFRHKLNYRQSCVNKRVYPSVFSIQESNFFKKKLVNNLLNIHIIPNVSENINRSTKQFNPIIKNNFFKKQYIVLMKIFIKIFNFIENLLSCSKLCINKAKCKYYIKKYMNSVFFARESCSVRINKYNKKVFNNFKMCCIEEKGEKSSVVLVQDLGVARVDIKNNQNIKPPMFINKDTMRRVPLLKHTRAPMAQRKSCYNKKVFMLPDINLLTISKSKKNTNLLELKKISQLLESKLAEYHITANVANIIPGPVITRFELNLSPGIKSSRITNLSRDLARVLYTASVRVVEVIPGTPYVGLEIPNKKRSIVYLGDIISSEQFRNTNTPLPLVLGKDISGHPLIVDLKSMPHLLVAGTTGSGKSVGINAMIVSILYKATPEEVCFIMIDPKILELSIYSGIPHLLKQVITDMKEVYEALQWCIKEMERRYKLMAMLGVRNLENYNKCIEQFYSKKYMKHDTASKFINDKTVTFSDILEKLPYIVVIVDEFSDLIVTTKKVEELVIRLTQKARAAGIHVILATQRPSVDVITGLIKANIPARIAFTVSSKIDSHTILGQSGSESLLGMGDMLYLGPNSSVPTRVHGAFIEDQEIYAVANFWKSQTANL
ncbi:DNA translocase FtsK 4TM domain-containing protein [Candidatus Blochmannia sp. SNP]|uniref:DNA translocase FtsK n=1 Tax=Candidatus Blochmannia sp. SNP TaxID=3118169 RepID=UPI003FCC7977